MTKHSDLQARIKRITTGAPIGQLENYGNGYAKDQRGFLFRIDSVEGSEVRKRIAKQKAEGRKEAFTFNVMERMSYVGDVLTSAQCGYLLVLSTYINYGGLIVKSERDDTPMSQTDMLVALKLKETQRSTLTDFLSACMNYGIITRDSEGYSINNGFHFRGNNGKGDNVVRSYITKLREMASVHKPEEVGFLYKLIPYIHKTTNMLCENPNELSPSKVTKLNRKQLAEVTGVNVSYVSRATRTMIYNGKSVFAKITTATDGTFYMLNPSIFRRADRYDYDETTRGIFGIE